ncbi:hypothetical protein [Kitasatospora sp. NPDC057500]|uniref:hypothetical protein n=1 Tax=Kitasatospora sp. NPDC057500 TaxID=3346151 RepID=UPI0036B207DE
MDAAERRYPARRSRRRGAQHDPMGTALTTLWGLGHLAVLALLGLAAEHQLGSDNPRLAAPGLSLPDHEPAA